MAVSFFKGHVEYFSSNSFKKNNLIKEWPGYQYLAWKNRSQASPQRKFFVAPHLGRFVWAEKGISVESLAMARAFAFFLEREDLHAINLTEFNQYVFGLEEFDSFLHYRKVYNLVSRMKKITEGGFRFKLRENVIHVQINSQKFFLCKNGPSAQAHVIRWRELLSRIRRHFEVGSVSRAKKREAAGILPVFSLKGHYSRAELQDLFQ